ncbi:hypothetical protein GCM10009840_26320 [Pseudolysinimonas kribbensis]|uniref:LPXTG cell wall anchor domain-containing protein n=1 Tax=Pseudolysinimonas kribbensis TaxID=433641 RepID=UPI0031D280BD
MKLTRLVAASAATALLGAAALAAATPAFAIPAPSTQYVTASQFVAEASPYPHQWFKGNVTAPVGTYTSVPTGLTVNGNAQPLNGDTPTTGLANLVSGASFTADGPAAFQIPIFTNTDATDAASPTGFTTLVPDDITPGALHTTTWHSTQDISRAGTVQYTANTSHFALADLETYLSGDTTPYTILAYGFYVDSSFTTTLHTVTWDGVTTDFMAAPTATLSATSLTTKQVTSTGIDATFTGFVPGELVDFGYGSGQSGDSYGAPVAADANGTVSVHFVAPTGFTAGTYTLGAYGETSTFSAVGTFTVADPAPAASLAATGIDATPYLIAAAALLVFGAAFGVIAWRRRRVDA